MKITFHEPDTPDVVATATWDGRRAVIEAEDASIRDAVRRFFRPVPVVVDDAAYRTLSAHGESVLQPGTPEWFRAAAIARAPEAGFAARVVPEAEAGAGWDPAANYRTFRDQVRRIEHDGGTGD